MLSDAYHVVRSATIAFHNRILLKENIMLFVNFGCQHILQLYQYLREKILQKQV